MTTSRRDESGSVRDDNEKEETKSISDSSSSALPRLLSRALGCAPDAEGVKDKSKSLTPIRKKRDWVRDDTKEREARASPPFPRRRGPGFGMTAKRRDKSVRVRDNSVGRSKVCDPQNSRTISNCN